MTPDHRRDQDRFLEPVSETVVRILPTVLVVGFAVLTLIGVVLLRPTGAVRPDLAEIGINPQTIAATVIEAADVECAGIGPDSDLRCVDITYRLAQGPDVGSTTIQQFVVHESNPTFSVGDEVTRDLSI